MNTDDDQDWVDALAGRDTPATPAAREAAALREALRAAAASSAADLPANVSAMRNPSREDELIGRAVREGIIEPPRGKRRRRSGLNWQLPLAASVLLMFGAGLYLQMQPATVPVERGSDDEIVRLRADDAAALKLTILNELRAVGVEATGYEALGVHGIDADLEWPLSAQVKEVLAAHDIPEPPDGALRIEIRSRE